MYFCQDVAYVLQWLQVFLGVFQVFQKACFKCFILF
jgi:hypothetical protein